MAKQFNQPLKGRGALGNPDNRFEEMTREVIDDGWGNLEETQAPIQTTLTVDSAKSIISFNKSPDVPFDRSINPYRGCEHGCVYCFARPTHAYLGLSPGIDFETQLYYKPDAAELLRNELGKRNYQCQPIALGINTDAYQPVERKQGITRQLLEILVETKHPISIVTKSALIERDIDLLAKMANDNLVNVAISITTLNHDLSRRLEPRASAPTRRMETVKRLTEAGIPTAVFVAPIIPALTDSELETILTQAHKAGAYEAAYIILRLPHELADMVYQWLQKHEPLKAEHVMNRIRDLRGGQTYQSQFGSRMSGTGIYADLLRQRYLRCIKKLGFKGMPELETTHFIKPVKQTPQMALF